MNVPSSMQTRFLFRLCRVVCCLVLCACASFAQEASKPVVPSILFIGNSYTYGAGSPVRFYRPNTVTDLNGEHQGGVPALFKIFSEEAGCKFAVNLETSPGRNLDYHLKQKADVINRKWDYVVLQGYSTLNRIKPGDPALLIESARGIVEMLKKNNPHVEIRFVSTWSRADQTYPEAGHWHGRPIEQMALDVRKGYDLAASACLGSAHSVIPVGEAWNLAIRHNLADANPYDGISPGQINLWTHDSHHASAYGYYLSALMIFGDVTGRDPRMLGKDERAALELGFSSEQAEALQQIAYEELTSIKGRAALVPFTPVSDLQK